MAAFHDSDPWFICGIIVIVLNIAFVSCWYRVRNTLYSSLWPIFSFAEILSAILSIILHSKLSNPPLLLATALWSLFGLYILVQAITRSYLRIISTLSPEQKKKLRFLQWTQYISWVGIPFFISGTACWAQSDSDTANRVYWRNVGRALNWTGCGLIVICFLFSTAAGIIIALWSVEKAVPAPPSTVIFGALLATPFVLTRFAFQLYWMKFRNTSGADYGLHIGGAVVMDLIIPIIYLVFAWYTTSWVKSKNFSTHEPCNHLDVPMCPHREVTPTKTPPMSNLGARKTSASTTVSNASTATTASDFSTMSHDEGKVNSRLPRSFVVNATGRHYEMDNANVLVKNTRRVYKVFHGNADDTSAQSAAPPYPRPITADAQRALSQIAKILWLFTLWECSKEEDSELRQAIEVDIIAIWYGDLYHIEGERRPASPIVRNMRPFNEIKDTVLGGQPRQPMEKMLVRVFLHFFDKIENHGTEARAAACLFALKAMLKKDIKRTQSFRRPSFSNVNEAAILEVDEDMWRMFDELASKGKHPKQ